MKVLKLTIVILVLLSVLIITGCQEEYSRQDSLTRTDKVAYEPTGTGYWKPKAP